MSLCPCTGCRITLHAVTHTQFFFCNQKQRLPAKSMLFQDFKSFPCNRTGNRFCSQIKDSFWNSFSNGAHSRIQTWHRFAHTCGCLDKQLLFPQNGPVNTMYQFPLSLPVRERKFQSDHGCIPHFFPLLMPVGPDIVGIGKFLKPCFQFLRIEHIGEPANLFRFHVAVCHLYFHLFQLILFCIDRRITPGLCKMYRNRFFHKPEFPVYAFDLIDHHMIFFFLYSIRPAFHEQI